MSKKKSSKKKPLVAADIPPCINHPEIDRICDDLFVAFPWCETKEGYTYWHRIWVRLNQIAGRE